MAGSYEAVYLAETNQNVHLKWVHFIIYKLCVKQLKYNDLMFML